MWLHLARILPPLYEPPQSQGDPKMLRRFYEWILAKASHPRAEWWLAFFSFADGGLFPFPPHPLVGLMCLAQPKKAVRYALITTVFSVMGGVFGYALGHFLYDAVGQQLLGLLGLKEKFPIAACYLNQYGAEIIMVKGLTPIPFLLITITAGFVSFPLLTFIGASLVSRGAIFLTIGILFRVFGAPIKRMIDKYFGLIATGLLVLIVSGYLAVAYFGGGAKAAHDRCEPAAAGMTGIQ
jgi:membrane protein YqaA with SNARE-associated domain